MVKYFTREGFEAHQQRIKNLEKELSEFESRVQHNIEVGGDQWHDNSGYEYLVQQIDVANRRLCDAYNEVKSIEIIEYPKTIDRVVCGCKVHFLMDGHEKKFDIVTYGEADAENNKILYECPIAEAMMGRKVGEHFNSTINGTKKEIRILDIQPLK